MVSVMPAFADDKASDRNSPPKTETGAQNKTETGAQNKNEKSAQNKTETNAKKPSAAERLILLGCMVSTMHPHALAYENAINGNNPPKTEKGAQKSAATDKTEQGAQKPPEIEGCPACEPIDGSFFSCSGSGWRNDQIQFAGSKWSCQNMGALELDIRLTLIKHLVFECNGEYARSLFSKRKGEVWDIYTSTGYRFERKIMCLPMSFEPLIGYSSHHQFIKGPFHHLSTSYNYLWKGPYVGLASYFPVNKKIEGFIEYQFHWKRFHSKFEGRGPGGFHSIFNTNTDNAFGCQVTMSAIYKQLLGVWSGGVLFEYKGFWANKSRRDHGREFFGIRHFDANWNSFLVVSQLSLEF